MRNLIAIAILFTASAAFATVPVPSYTGYTGSFQIQTKISDALGTSDIQWIDMSIGYFGDPNVCKPHWAAGNSMWLYNDAGTALMGGYIYPANNTISNSQCTLKIQTSNIQVVGNDLYITWDIQFQPTYSGSKTIYMVAGGSQGNDGWHSVGTITTGPSYIPSVSLSSPVSGGTGSVQNFTVQVSDAAGNQDISWMDFAVGYFGDSNICHTTWSPGNYLQLMNDSGVGVAGSGYAGNSGSAQNNQCILNFAGSSVLNSGTSKYVTFALTLLKTGTQPLYSVAGSSAGHSGWQSIGTWTVPPIYDTLSAVDANLTVMLANDVDGTLIRKPTSTEPWIVRLKSGREIKVPNAANIRVAKAVSNWEPVGDSFVYHFHVDTADPSLWGFRLGLNEDTFWMDNPENTLNMPKGWMGSAYAWSTLDNAERSDSSEFAIKSKWRPGLLPMFLASNVAKEPAPYGESTEDNMRIAKASDVEFNSLRKFVIGPAIKPNITKAELDDLIDRWVNYYGMKFLKPLTEGKNLADLEQPEGGFEQQILACLRAVEAK